MQPTVALDLRRRRTRTSLFASLLFWIVAYGLVSLGLVVATVKTFNRCLGRMDEGRMDGMTKEIGDVLMRS